MHQHWLILCAAFANVMKLQLSSTKPLGWMEMASLAPPACAIPQKFVLATRVSQLKAMWLPLLKFWFFDTILKNTMKSRQVCWGRIIINSISDDIWRVNLGLTWQSKCHFLMPNSQHVFCPCRWPTVSIKSCQHKSYLRIVIWIITLCMNKYSEWDIILYSVDFKHYFYILLSCWWLKNVN